MENLFFLLVQCFVFIGGKPVRQHVYVAAQVTSSGWSVCLVCVNLFFSTHRSDEPPELPEPPAPVDTGNV